MCRSVSGNETLTVDGGETVRIDSQVTAEFDGHRLQIHRSAPGSCRIDLSIPGD